MISVFGTLRVEGNKRRRVKMRESLLERQDAGGAIEQNILFPLTRVRKDQAADRTVRIDLEGSAAITRRVTILCKFLS